MARAVDVYVGNRIRDRRIELGISQGELAEKVGIDIEQLNDQETGIERVSPEDLVKIAITLRCPFSWLYGVRAKPLSGLGFTGDDRLPPAACNHDPVRPGSWQADNQPPDTGGIGR